MSPDGKLGAKLRVRRPAGACKPAPAARAPAQHPPGMHLQHPVPASRQHNPALHDPWQHADTHSGAHAAPRFPFCLGRSSAVPVHGAPSAPGCAEQQELELRPLPACSTASVPHYPAIIPPPHRAEEPLGPRNQPTSHPRSRSCQRDATVGRMRRGGREKLGRKRLNSDPSLRESTCEPQSKKIPRRGSLTCWR